MATNNDLLRFWSKVDRKDDDQCWPWLASADGHGRGQFWMNGKRHRAPRVAWSIHHGKPFPSELLACHTCDNPNCVNPHHIFVGTMSDNIIDAVIKGRHKSNPHASGWQKHKEECKRGHPFTRENTFINGRGSRCCRACAQMHREAYDTRNPEHATRQRSGQKRTHRT